MKKELMTLKMDNIFIEIKELREILLIANNEGFSIYSKNPITINEIFVTDGFRIANIRPGMPGLNYCYPIIPKDRTSNYRTLGGYGLEAKKELLLKALNMTTKEHQIKYDYKKFESWDHFLLHQEFIFYKIN